MDKSNVLETSQLWRKVIVEVAADFPDVELEHILVDNCAMQLVLNPTRFDIVVTENMFGDILSDEGAVLAGSIGMLPSASIGEQKPSGAWVGLYEPVHGSARTSPGRTRPIRWVPLAAWRRCWSTPSASRPKPKPSTIAIEAVLNSGQVTADLKPKGTPRTTEQVGAAICEAI